MTALKAMAAYVSEFHLDQGGTHLRTALLAQILADRYGLEPSRAVRVARGEESDDDGIAREAGVARDELIEQARLAALAAEMGEVRA